MKKAIALVILMCFICMFSTACDKKTEEKVSLWDDAAYTENVTLGNGDKTIELEVKAEDKSVTFSIKTDAENLEDALCEHKLIEGEEGPYGLYIKKVNGITADYDIDQSFWSLSQDGTPSLTCASGAEINGGEHFEFIYTK